jgi:hypothetical protein
MGLAEPKTTISSTRYTRNTRLLYFFSEKEEERRRRI